MLRPGCNRVSVCSRAPHAASTHHWFNLYLYPCTTRCAPPTYPHAYVSSRLPFPPSGCSLRFFCIFFYAQQVRVGLPALALEPSRAGPAALSWQADTLPLLLVLGACGPSPCLNSCPFPCTEPLGAPPLTLFYRSLSLCCLSSHLLQLPALMWLAHQPPCSSHDPAVQCRLALESFCSCVL